MQSEKVFALAIAAAPLLLTLAQWGTFRIARRTWLEARPGERFAWTVGRLAAFAGLIATGLVAFPAALYALLMSLLVVPWPISWPAAAALFATGIVGIRAAFVIFSKSPGRIGPIRVSGFVNAAVLAWGSLQLMLAGGPPAWFQPGVREGAGRLEKKLLLSLHDIGNVTDINYGDVRGTGAAELSVAGNFGARFFGESLQPQASVDFDLTKPPSTYPVEIVPRSRSNPLMFYRHATWSQYDSLFDANGKELWRTPHGCLTGAMVSNSAEASPDFLCVQGGPKCCALEKRSVANATVWSIPVDWVFDLAFLGPEVAAPIVIDQEGTEAGATEFVGLDLRGQHVFNNRPVVSLLGGFSAIHWPGVCAQCLLLGSNNEFFVVKPEGTKVLMRLAPAFYLSHTRSTSVRLAAHDPPMLAVIGEMEYKSFGRATFHGALFVFDASGKTVYAEVLPERAEAIATRPTSANDRDVLLVGGENKVWEYSAPHE